MLPSYDAPNLDSEPGFEPPRPFCYPGKKYTVTVEQQKRTVLGKISTLGNVVSVRKIKLNLLYLYRIAIGKKYYILQSLQMQMICTTNLCFIIQIFMIDVFLKNWFLSSIKLSPESLG